MGNGPTKLGWLREKADAEMVFEKELQIEVMVNMHILI
jgi:hypothetical protein